MDERLTDEQLQAIRERQEAVKATALKEHEARQALEQDGSAAEKHYALINAEFEWEDARRHAEAFADEDIEALLDYIEYLEAQVERLQPKSDEQLEAEMFQRREQEDSAERQIPLCIDTLNDTIEEVWHPRKRLESVLWYAVQQMGMMFKGKENQFVLECVGEVLPLDLTVGELHEKYGRPTRTILLTLVSAPTSI